LPCKGLLNEIIQPLQLALVCRYLSAVDPTYVHCQQIQQSISRFIALTLLQRLWGLQPSSHLLKVRS